MHTRVRILSGSVGVLVLALFLVQCRPQPAPLRLDVYGFAADAAVQEVLTQAQGDLGAEVTLKDLAVRENGECFSQMLQVINLEGDIPFLPNSVERRTAPPYVHYNNQNRYYSEYLSSLTVVTRGDTLVAIVLGATWYGEGFWDTLPVDADTSFGITVYLPSGIYQVTDQSVIDDLTVLAVGD